MTIPTPPGAARVGAQLPVEVLRCPVTHGPLHTLEPADTRRVYERAAAGELRHRDDRIVAPAVDTVLADAEEQVAYVVRNGIARLLATDAIMLDGDRHGAGAAADDHALRAEKEAVQAFYDEQGWQKDNDDQFRDTALFLDPRPDVGEYIRRCQRRVLRHLRPGDFLLDVASGPVHLPEYRAYDADFGGRICVDLSEVALREAQGNVGDRGVYVIGDITNLPFVDGSLDGVVSLHTIYHVPRDEQATALREIHRVLRPGHTAVVVYFWQTTPFGELSGAARLSALPWRAVRKAGRALGARLRPVPEGAEAPDLYYHAYDYRWFTRQDWPFEPEVLCSSSVTTDALRRWIPGGFLARPLLSALFWLEDRAPRLAGRFGRYPLIVIRK